MKNQNFYMRVISLLLVILAVLFYNSSMKAQANEKEIAALTDKVDTLQEQQNQCAGDELCKSYAESGSICRIRQQ